MLFKHGYEVFHICRIASVFLPSEEELVVIVFGGLVVLVTEAFVYLIVFQHNRGQRYNKNLTCARFLQSFDKK